MHSQKPYRQPRFMHFRSSVQRGRKSEQRLNESTVLSADYSESLQGYLPGVSCGKPFEVGFIIMGAEDHQGHGFCRWMRALPHWPFLPVIDLKWPDLLPFLFSDLLISVRLGSCSSLPLLAKQAGKSCMYGLTLLKELSGNLYG